MVISPPVKLIIQFDYVTEGEFQLLIDSFLLKYLGVTIAQW